MRPKVAIFYTHFPHYRQAVFDAILNDPSLDVEIYYDCNGIDESIISGKKLIGHNHNRNFKLSKLYFELSSISSSISGKFDYYIFLGNPYVLSYWISLSFLKISNKKTALWTHGWYQDKRSLKDMLRNSFYKLSNRLFLYNDRSKKIGIEYGFNANKMSVIYNSLNFKHQKKVRENAISSNLGSVKSVNSSKDYFLFVGRLVDSAGVDFIMRSICKFRNAFNREIELVIVGDGPNKKDLIELSIETNISAKFLNAIYDEEKLSRLFMNAVAVISPNKVGLLAMHAFVYGCPVITHSDMNFQMPEAEAVVHENTGYLFKRGSKKSLVEMMAKSLSDSKDIALSEKISQNCYRVIDECYNYEFQSTSIRDCILLDLFDEK